MWTLDGVGNRLTETITNHNTNQQTSNKTYTYNARDQLTQMSDPPQQLVVDLSYDLNGNRIEKRVTKTTNNIAQTQTTTYQYDVKDRLIDVHPNAPNTNNQKTIRYQYDAQDRRIEKQTYANNNGVVGNAIETKIDLYQNQTLQHEATKSNNSNTDTPNATGLKISDTYRRGSKLDRHIEFAPSGNGGGTSNAQQSVRYYQLDALDTPIALTTTTGTTTDRNQFDAWGNLQTQTANGNNVVIGQQPNTNPNQTGQAALLRNDNQSIGFTGYIKDDDTGLYYAGARDYDPLMGSFNAMDPVFGNTQQPITFNKYLYANANPTVYIDPDGRCGVFAYALPMAGGNLACNLFDGALNRVNPMSPMDKPRYNNIATPKAKKCCSMPPMDYADWPRCSPHSQSDRQRTIHRRRFRRQ
ncbi:MAG: RHS repeat-associated core domain-containing protein [Brachymonas sp.]|nr:RHS repeat-associated core domain-containing protein [Brachymonas sp.]